MKRNFIGLVVLFSLLMSASYANALNQNVSDANLTQTQKELMVQNQKLQHVIDKLNDTNSTYTKFDTKALRSKINFLQNRININKRQRNNLAVSRDEIKTIMLKEKILYQSTLARIVKAKREYRSKDYIANILDVSIKQIEKNPIDKFTSVYEANKDTNSPVANDLKQNYENLYNQKYDYLFILKNLADNISKFRQPSFFADDLSLKKFTNKIDTEKSIAPISALMRAYMDFTIGELAIVLAIILVFWMFERVLVPIISTIIVRALIRNKQEDKIQLRNTMKESIKKPLKYMLRFTAISISLAVIIENIEVAQKIAPWLNSIFMAILAWIVYRILDNVIDVYAANILNKYPNVRKEMIVFILKIIKIILIILVAMFLLTQLGMDIKAIAASLGVGGIAVALAAKDTLENFFASIIIMADNSFSQGDWIKTSEVEGTVVDIRMRSTRIRTFDNSMITIPNSRLANAYVQNWSKRKIGRRIKMSIGLTYESSMEDIQQLKKDIHKMLLAHPGIATEKNASLKYTSKKLFESIKKDDLHGVKKTLLVFIDEYSASSIDILIYCFTKSPDWENWLTVKEDVIIKISDLVKKNNCEFAYPTETLWLKKEA